ncbi:MAG: glycosyltransferase family 4 protein [Pseudomonadota bacterium]
MAGVFRYVQDLIIEQARLGFEVGLICDRYIANEISRYKTQEFQNLCKLGIFEIPMTTRLGFSDIRCLRKIRKIAENSQAHVLHGHGPKAAAYTRLATAKMNRHGKKIASFYTPLSQNIDSAGNTFTGSFKRAAERRLATYTDGIIFESTYCANIFQQHIGDVLCPHRIIPHGIRSQEVEGHTVNENVYDFIFAGDLNKNSGIDLFIKAMSNITVQTPVTALIVGNGSEKTNVKRQIRKLGFSQHIQLQDQSPYEADFRQARCCVIPARRQEIFPYIFLNAALSEIPIIATNTGIISEITSGTSKTLLPTDDSRALLERMEAFLLDSLPFEIEAELFAEHVDKMFSAQRMTDAIMEFYFTAVI